MCHGCQEESNEQVDKNSGPHGASAPVEERQTINSESYK